MKRRSFSNFTVEILPVVWTLWPIFDGVFDRYRELKRVQFGPLRIEWRYYEYEVPA